MLDIFEQDDVLAGNRGKAARFSELLTPLASPPGVQNFRHIGMIWAFEVVDAPAHFSWDFHQRALALGLLLRPIGNTVYFMPPYVIGEAEMELMAGVTLELLSAH